MRALCVSLIAIALLAGSALEVSGQEESARTIEGAAPVEVTGTYRRGPCSYAYGNGTGPQRRAVAVTRGTRGIGGLHAGVRWVRAHRLVVVAGGHDMRFEELTGLTGLSIDRLRHRFRNEEVITLLPVSDELTGRDCLLVATPAKLAVVIADSSPTSEEWTSRWAPWEVVRLAHEAEPLAEAYCLTVYVGSLTFHAYLCGDAGQRGLRDFVVATQDRQEALTRSARATAVIGPIHRPSPPSDP